MLNEFGTTFSPLKAEALNFGRPIKNNVDHNDGSKTMQRAPAV
jgi:hypothetical protein